MFRKTFIASACVLLTAGLVACGGSNDDDDTPAPVAVGDTIALTASGSLISFNRATPGTLVGQVTVSGLASGESLVGIDIRPADGLLYGISNQGRIHTVDASTGVATLRSTLSADPADTSFPFVAWVGDSYGIDFNPTVDRLRAVSSSGQNLRINVDTGATITDGPLNIASVASGATAAAYTNSFDAATATQLFVLNPADDQLYLQNPPNDGTLASPVSLGVSFDASAGFDIDADTNIGYAALTSGGTTTLVSIDLAATSAAATSIGAIAGGAAILGLALNDAPLAAEAVGLTTANQLVRFNPRTPNTIASTTAITGLAGGETVVGIDFRPANGMLYALTDAARLYTVDPATGAATAPVTLVDNTTPPIGAGGSFTGLSGTVFSVDFNPVPDRLRVVSNTGQSLRINVDNGLTLVDGSINRTPAASVVAAAYTNSFGPSPRTAPPAVGTTLFNLETNSNVLTRQDPPNAGTLVDIGALGIDPGTAAGFDIGGSRNGLVLAAVGSGPTLLYQVNLMTGAATLPRGLTADTARIGGAGGAALLDIAVRF